MKNFNRRTIFKLGFLSLIPALKTLASSCPLPLPTSGKAFKKLLKFDSRIAKRLKFVPVAKNFPSRKGDGHCGVCKFYKSKKAINGYAPCVFASNRYVPSCGYCKQFKLDKKRIS